MAGAEAGAPCYPHRPMRTYSELYIDGGWVEPEKDAGIDVIDAAREEVIGRVPAGTAGDVDRAVRAARRAFDGWAATPVGERASLLDRIAGGLEARVDEIAHTIAREVGMPLPLSTAIQAALPVQVVRATAELVRAHRFEEAHGPSTVVSEPVGVVGCITPWNYPLHQIVAKVAPALAAGCTVVVKPSEVAPLNAFILADVVHAARAPRGVFNLVSGEGVPAGEAIAAHAEVDMVSFTGSTRAGRRVAELAAQGVKRVALELGGKSASVVLDDADLEQAVKKTVSACYLNSGQTCSAWTRLLVPRARHDEAALIAKRAAERYTLGDPLEGKAKLGPLVSAAQRERVLEYIRVGIAEGATLVTGGAEPPDGLERGYFVRPTVFAGVRNDMRIAQEEIFGPVLCIIPYEDEEDAVRIANDTIYGLAGGVWSSDRARALGVARRLRAGQVDVNGAGWNPAAPFGGFKQSGYGREFGKWGLEEYLEVKAIQG
jgi:betaine-aldehyde dehydrogenase